MPFARTRSICLWATLALAAAALPACGAQSVSPEYDGGDAHVTNDASGGGDSASVDVVHTDGGAVDATAFDVREGDGGVCPPYNAVADGIVCDVAGATCWGHDPACNDPGVTQCTCTGGAWHCDSPAGGCRDAGACPVPSQIHAGGSCYGDNWCASSDPVRDCNGNVIGSLECHCEGGAWYCPQTGMYCPPPDAGNDCVYGAACSPGQSCSTNSECPVYCSCDSSGHYVCEGPPCLPDAGACPDPSQVGPGAACTGSAGCPSWLSVTDCQGNTYNETCYCDGSTWQCPVPPPGPPCPTDAGACPDPSQVTPGGVCSPVGAWCAGPTYTCPGSTPFTVNCTCDDSGHWLCPVVDCPPPPDGGTCPVDLQPGGACVVDGAYCPGPTQYCGDAGIQLDCTCSGGVWLCPVVDCA